MNKVPLGQKIKTRENERESYFKKQVERVLEKSNTVHSHKCYTYREFQLSEKLFVLILAYWTKTQ